MKIDLNDGHAIAQNSASASGGRPPRQPPTSSRRRCETGYRHIDTATITATRQAWARRSRPPACRARRCSSPPSCGTTRRLRDRARGGAGSLDRLKLDDVDLYLIHWPTPQQGQYIETWRALIELRRKGWPARSASPTSTPTICGLSSTTAASRRRSIRWSCTRVSNSRACATRTPRGGSRQNAGRRSAGAPARRSRHHRHRRQTSALASAGRDPLASGRGLDRHSQDGAAPASEENVDVFGFTLDDEDHQAIAALDSRAGARAPIPRGR